MGRREQMVEFSPVEERRAAPPTEGLGGASVRRRVVERGLAIRPLRPRHPVDFMGAQGLE